MNNENQNEDWGQDVNGGNEDWGQDVNSQEVNIQESQGNNENNGSNTNQPVAMSKKKTGLILIIILFIVMIILYSVRGCSVIKKSDGSSNSTVASTASSETTEGTTENIDESVPNNTENVATTEGVSSASTEENTTENNVGTNPVFIVNSTEESNNTSEVSTTEIPTVNNENSESMQEVDTPVLGEVVATTGIVSGKTVYKVGNEYVYVVKLIVVVGDDKNISCKYYCTRRSWDSVNSGNSVNVVIKTDTEGTISIESISNQ